MQTTCHEHTPPRDPLPRGQRCAICARLRIEERVCKRLVRDLLALGPDVVLRVSYGDQAEPWTRDAGKLLDALGACDEEWLQVARMHPDQPKGQRIERMGSVFLVYGNDGWDVICDHHESLSPVLDPITDWCNAQEAA